jgi:hypothetical protein
MKISIKRQTNRSTTWTEGANCVNLFLEDKHSNTAFEMGLQTTAWGDKKEIKPALVTFSIDGKDYRIPFTSLKNLIKEAQME